ncbi:uncharacterized protein LOC129571622 [Sitodiplosis mosellana]|uniref:uncharacterized protein LOC129571622 n=1 Tax=Sitodiplosis mosellana TaxID=263140 RepID=UPI0024452E55|nr:uncharacterized protein LOC129571622 [Sitodiplosis mosellana]
MSLASNTSSVLDAVGPLQGKTPKPKSNRGRKPMESAELTSPETMSVLKQKALAKAQKAAAKAEKAVKKATPKKPTPKKAAPKRATSKATPPPKRRRTEKSPPSDEDTDFCIICLTLLPNKLTAENSIQCNVCTRPVHLKCADMRASFFTCKHCDSDMEQEEDEDFDDDDE